MAADLPAELREAAGRAEHDDYRAASKDHPPEVCPCRDGHDYQHVHCSAGCNAHDDRGGLRYCGRCGLDVLLADTMLGMCRRCSDDMRPWPDLTEAQREAFRASQDPALSVVAPALAQAEERADDAHAQALGMTCQAEFAAASDALLRQTLAEALESGASRLCDAGAWQAFVERALTIPTTPGVAALREVVACARHFLAAALGEDRRLATKRGAALLAALARLDACAAGGKEPT